MIEATDTIDSDQAKWLDRVQALLNQAESTNFPEEAEAFTEKAAEIMAKFAITEMMFDFNSDKPEEVEVRVYWVKAPYAKDRVNLMYSTAKAMGCNMYFIPTRRDGHKTRTNSKNHDLETRIVGFAGDIEKVVAMYESLVKQEAVARAFALKNDPMMTYIRQGEKKIWNASFIRGFSAETGRRIRAAYNRVEKREGKTAALAVIDRKKKVEQFYGTLHLRRTSTSQRTSYDGGAAGRQAGKSATISKAVGR